MLLASLLSQPLTWLQFLKRKNQRLFEPKNNFLTSLRKIYVAYQFDKICFVYQFEYILFFTSIIVIIFAPYPL